MTATYNYLGYGVTDNQGKAKLEYDSEGNPLTHSYTGTGAGKVDIVASLDSEITDGSLVSETYELYDCLIYDEMETDYINKYKISNNANISYSSEWAISGSRSLKWNYDNTASSNTMYWGIYFKENPTTNFFDISQLKGNGIKFEFDANAQIDFDTPNNKGMYVGIFYKTTENPSWSPLGSIIKLQSNTTHYEWTNNIPSNCTELWVRFNANTNCPSGVLYIDNWKLYLI